jgi:uncharacterized protein (TIGR03067 family)
MLTISLLIIGSTLAAPAPEDGAKKAQDELQGTWAAIAAEEVGRKISADELKEENLSISIRGNELTLRRGKDEGKFEGRLSFTLDPTKKPAHIDFKEVGDKARPGVIHAIYALEKGELWICLGSKFTPDEEKDRPQEFATGRGESAPKKGSLLFTFKPDKPK